MPSRANNEKNSKKDPNIREISLFDKQLRAFSFDTQFGAAIAGVQSGKTFVGSIWAGKKMGEFPETNGIIMAPTYKILHASTLDKLFQNFPGLRAPHTYKEAKGEIQLPTGGTVYLRSADQPLGIEGITADWIWMDEAGQMPRMAWTIAKSRIAMTGGQIFITSTPYTLNWFFEDFYLRWKNKDDDRLSVFTWASIENPYFPREHFEAERKALSPEEFNRRYCGEFTKMEGLVYDLKQEQIIYPKDIEAVDVFAGMDFGYRNPASIVVIKRDKNDNYYVVDEWYEAEKLQIEVEDALRELQRKHGIKYTYADPAEPDRIQSLKNRGFVIRSVDKNVELGITKVRELINTRKLFVFNTCENVLDEFNSYHYDPERMREEPVKENDHAMDALRYALYNYSPSSNVMPKPITPVKPYYESLGI